RVLQEREVLPVGASTPIPVDVRVIAATHQDLPARVESKAFRQDLYGRLDGFNLVLPALRNRREDIGILVGALLRRMCGTDADDITLQRSAARALFDYDWPQNIRELEQAIRYAVSLASNQTIQLEHLPEKLRKKATPTNALSEDHLLQRAHLTELLTKHRGNVSAVAREMGRQRVSVHRWLKRFGISPKPFRV
ncbi:MAG: sigma 54-interacting transcriptional regulator, partial [Myxococcota bacterium]